MKYHTILKAILILLLMTEVNLSKGQTNDSINNNATIKTEQFKTQFSDSLQKEVIIALKAYTKSLDNIANAGHKSFWEVSKDFNEPVELINTVFLIIISLITIVTAYKKRKEKSSKAKRGCTQLFIKYSNLIISVFSFVFIASIGYLLFNIATTLLLILLAISFVIIFLAWVVLEYLKFTSKSSDIEHPIIINEMITPNLYNNQKIQNKLRELKIQLAEILVPTKVIVTYSAYIKEDKVEERVTIACSDEIFKMSMKKKVNTIVFDEAKK